MFPQSLVTNTAIGYGTALSAILCDTGLLSISNIFETFKIYQSQLDPINSTISNKLDQMTQEVRDKFR